MSNFKLDERSIRINKRNSRRYFTILIFLSVMVAVIVASSLIKPAVSQTMTCQKEEHTHTISVCYSVNCVFTDEETHIHNSECYDENNELICGKHEHIFPDCYVLTCEQEEHSHDDACFSDDEDIVSEEITETEEPEETSETEEPEEITETEEIYEDLQEEQTEQTQLSAEEELTSETEETETAEEYTAELSKEQAEKLQALKERLEILANENKAEPTLDSDNSKGKYDQETKIITWIHAIKNSEEKDLKGYTVNDTELKNAETVKIYDSTGQLIETLDSLNSFKGTNYELDKTTGIFKFGENQTNMAYKLEYSYTADESSQTVTNKAVLKNADSTVIYENDFEDVVINSPVVLSGESFELTYTPKDQYAYVFDKDDNCKFLWTFTANQSSGAYNNSTLNAVLTTENPRESNYHYITPEFQHITPEFQQTVEITAYDGSGSAIALTKDTDYEILWYDESGNQITEGSVNAFKFEIKFKDTANVSNLCDFTLKYYTLGDTTYQRDKMRDCDVTVKLEMKYTDKDDNIKFHNGESPTIPKKFRYMLRDYMGQQVRDGFETSHEASELEKTADGKYKLSWQIFGNCDLKYIDTDNTTITYTNTIPAGLTLIENTIKFKDEGNSQETPSKGDGWNYEITTGSDNRQVITFTVNETRHTDKFYITYDVEVDPQYLIANAVKNSNGVTIQYQNDIFDGKYTEYQTQTINLPLIDKTAGQFNDTGKSVDYVIDVNPYGFNLVDNGGITINDELFFDTYQLAVSKLKNLEVYKIENGSETLLTQSTDYQITNAVSGNVAKFKLSLDDETHYKIKYTYSFVVKSDINWYRMENTAKITYGSYSETAKGTVEISNAKASAWSISVENVDSKNTETKLAGSKFRIYKWKTYPDEWVPVNDVEFVTDSSGRIHLQNLDKALFKIEQISAKSGYKPLTTPSYFAPFIPSDRPTGVRTGNVTIIENNGVLTIKNVLDETTEITAQKHWRLPSGNTPPDSVDVSLKLYESAIAPDGSVSGAIPVTVNFEGYEKTSGEHVRSITKQFYLRMGYDLNVTLRMINAWIQPWSPGKVANSIAINGSNVQIWKDGTIPSDAMFIVRHESTVFQGSQAVDGWYHDPELYSEYEVNYPCVMEPVVIDIICGETLRADMLTNVTEADFKIFDNGIMIGEEVKGIPDDATEKDTITLSNANSWSHTWNDLPKTDSFGNPLYYYIQEIPVPDGYTVSYGNNGINEGTVNIYNTQNGYVYIIPSTGGKGTAIYILTGTAIMISSVLTLLIIRKFRKRKNNF